MSLTGAFSTVSTALAPLVLGLLRDAQGSYVGGFWLVTALWLLCGLLVLISRPPQPAAPVAAADSPVAAGAARERG